jgi:hypothetical protein
MIVVFLLILINIYIFRTTHEPPKLVAVREKYTTLREHLKATGKYPMLHEQMPITAYDRMWDGSLGFNVNKGFELGLCLDGEVNEIFHILLHELAHCTVPEYDHSARYWNNYVDLRDIATSLGIYQKIPEKTSFCGKHVQDR